MLYNGFILKRRERYVDFNQGTLRAAGHDRPSRTSVGRFYSPEGHCGAAGDLGKYLENIIKLLVKAKLLNGLRGKGGGYQLTKAPEQYTVESILRVTEDSMAPVACLEPGAEACPRASECRTLSMWQGLDKLITEYFTNITLADLMRRAPDGYDYVI